MTLDLQALREAAEKATPGPYKLEEQGVEVLVNHDYEGEPCDETFAEAGHYGWSHEQTKANAAYIAAMDPATTLALLDEVERLRAFKERAFDLHRAWINDAFADERDHAAELLDELISLEASA